MSPPARLQLKVSMFHAKIAKDREGREEVEPAEEDPACWSN